MAELIESLPGKEVYVPQFEYLVIDEGHLPREQLEPLDNPVSGIFQLEQSRGVDEIRRIIDGLIEILDDPELRELRRDMATWLRRVVLPARLPDVDVPELHDLQEAKTMLEEQAATWPRKWMAEGYQKGEAAGLAKGEAAGLAKGEAAGHESGLREALTALAEEKFGSLSSRHLRRIAEASNAQLRRWLKCILTTGGPAELFKN